MTNVDTGVVKTVTTDDRGAYNLSDLLPGTYDVSIEAPSFQPFAQRGVPVTSNSIRRVDAQLSVSGVSETLEVTAAAPLLQTDRADIHFTQTARQVNDLPLAGTAGRNYQSLMQIVPGAVMAGRAELRRRQPAALDLVQRQRRVAPAEQHQARRRQHPVPLAARPTPPTCPRREAIQEVSIVTNSYNAEQGLAGGAAINVVIKSGTNDLHGTAWGYNTDSSLPRAQLLLRPRRTIPDGHAEPVRRATSAARS